MAVIIISLLLLLLSLLLFLTIMMGAWHPSQYPAIAVSGIIIGIYAVLMGHAAVSGKRVDVPFPIKDFISPGRAPEKLEEAINETFKERLLSSGVSYVSVRCGSPFHPDMTIEKNGVSNTWRDMRCQELEFDLYVENRNNNYRFDWEVDKNQFYEEDLSAATRAVNFAISWSNQEKPQEEIQRKKDRGSAERDAKVKKSWEINSGKENQSRVETKQNNEL